MMFPTYENDACMLPFANCISEYFPLDYNVVTIYEDGREKEVYGCPRCEFGYSLDEEGVSCDYTCRDNDPHCQLCNPNGDCAVCDFGYSNHPITRRCVSSIPGCYLFYQTLDLELKCDACIPGYYRKEVDGQDTCNWCQVNGCLTCSEAGTCD